ncbi:hypothetical protein KIH74_28525 [Kineosporia sp. J2-2]|uniref:Protein arginine N-methyltransferase 1 n=1 Tax=Kineosporia corallincola TaxID=2835133 RepID=A0ABS5TP94_9ACTN|nr:hypothetical protein [Kineosporia corallincola]
MLDIGAGTGLLSILSARAGARSVDAFEAHTEMAEVAARTIKASGAGDKVALHSTMSSNVSFLPGDRRNFLVTEIFDCGIIGEGILPTLRHARRSMLTPGYASIPQAATLSGRLVASPDIRRLNEVTSACDVDVSTLNELQTRGHFPVRLQTWDHTLVSAEAGLYHLDLTQEPPDPGQAWDVVFEADTTALADGIAAWFTMDLGAGEGIDTAPGTPSHWMQAFIPFPRPVQVIAGHPLTVSLSIEDEVSIVARPVLPDDTGLAGPPIEFEYESILMNGANL